MPLNIRWLIVFGLAISIAGTLPVEAKRKHPVSTAHQLTSARQPSHTHRSSARRPLGNARRTSANVKRKGLSSGTWRKHSIIGTAHKHSRAGKTVHVAKHAQTKAFPEPHADYVQDNQGLANVYKLYDRGVNERLEGRYEQATKTLLEATNSYSSTKKGLTLEAMIDYELGQAAEASNNYSVAADAYSRSLRIKPNLVEAAVRLASMLMKAGQPQAALSRARESVAVNPMDPRAHQILALVLDKNGLSDAAKAENDTAMRLMRSGSSVNTDPIDRTPVEPTEPAPASTPTTPSTTATTPSTSTTPETVPTTNSTTNSNADPAKVSAPIPADASKPKPLAEPVDSDVMP